MSKTRVSPLARAAYALTAWNRRMARISRVTIGALPRRPTLLIASMPKSGSTFLATALQNATGFRRVFLGESFMSVQDLSEAAIIDNLPTACVVHQHLEANQPNLCLLRRYRLPIVFQYRRLDDILVSIQDKLETDPWITPSFAAGPDFTALSAEEQMDGLLRLAGARFVQLYAGWQTACAQGWVEGLTLSYETMLEDKPAAVRTVLDHFNVTVRPDAIEQAVAETETAGTTRRNAGVVGRGRSRLSERHYRMLTDMAAPFPWVDFRPLGLDLPASRETPMILPTATVPV